MGTPFIGEIRMVAFNFSPTGWAFCDGQQMDISQNDALFMLIGTTYGGDGQTTFALPDLRGRIPIHQGTGAGLSMHVLAEAGGFEAVTLTGSQLPAHRHTPMAQSANGGLSSPNNGVWAGAPSSHYSSNSPSVPMLNSAIGAAGGSQPHDNMMPYLAINFVISLFGIFPSQI